MFVQSAVSNQPQVVNESELNMDCAVQKVKRSFMERITSARNINQRITQTARHCLLVLATRSNDTESCWPSIEQIAADMGCHRTTAIRAIQQLEEAGLIRVERRLLGNGRPAANVYQIICGDSSGERPIQSRSATGIVAESDGDSSGERLEGVIEGNTEESKEAVAREDLDYFKISKRLGSVAGKSINNMAPAIQDLSPIMDLINRGADLEMHIVPVVREVRDREPESPIRSWKYFVPAIEERLQRSIAARKTMYRIANEGRGNPFIPTPRDPDYVPYPNEEPGGSRVPAPAPDTPEQATEVGEDRDDLSDVFEYAEAFKPQEKGFGGLDRPAEHQGALHPLRVDGTRMDGGQAPC